MLLGTGWDCYEKFKEQKTKYEMVNRHGAYKDHLQNQKDMKKFSESCQWWIELMRLHFTFHYSCCNFCCALFLSLFEKNNMIVGKWIQRLPYSILSHYILLYLKASNHLLLKRHFRFREVRDTEKAFSQTSLLQ